MKVNVGSAGRFWAFDLAAELERRGNLERLYTGYPRWKSELPRERVETFPWLVAPFFLLNKLGIANAPDPMGLLTAETFDRWLARRLLPCDVFHCLSGFGSITYGVARERYHALVVCDCGSAHVRYRERLLAEEFDRWGMPHRGMHPRMVDRMLREYEEANLILVPSEFVRRSFLEEGVPAAKIIKVPFGVDLEMFHPIREDGIGREKGFRVIYAGALSVRKGLGYLLEAFASLRLPNAELWLVGAALPESKALLERFPGTYRRLGFVPRAALPALFSRGSVFVLPSVEEGLALVLAQAMACGLPVVATEHTGARELIVDGVEGLIVPIRSPEAIAERLAFLHKDSDARMQMGAAALERAKALGGWRHYADSVISAYASPIGRG